MIVFMPTDNPNEFTWKQGLEEIVIGNGKCNYHEDEYIECSPNCPCHEDPDNEGAYCGAFTASAILMGRGYPVPLKTYEADFKRENRIYKSTSAGLRRLLTEPWSIKCG